MGRRSTSVKINGERIKEVLQIKGMTITDLSKSIGYVRSGVSTSINANMMDEVMLEVIARELDCSKDYFKGIAEAEKPKYAWLLTSSDMLDSQGRVIPRYNEKQKSRLSVFRDYMSKLGERGIEDIDGGIIHSWKSDKVMNMCDASFEFRFTQYMLPFLKAEGFLPTLPSREANITEGE